MQSQQFNAHNHRRYNKFAHEGRAVPGTSSAQYKWTFVSNEKGEGGILSLDLTSRPYWYFYSQPLFRDTPNNPCNSHKLAYYSGFSSSLWFLRDL